MILGIDFVNNVDWYVKQLNLSGNWLASVKNFSASFFGSFRIGYELLIYNGILTYLGLLLISKKPEKV